MRRDREDLSSSRRVRIAFFGSADVFEDFYPHYGIDQHRFATEWSGSGNHKFVRLLQDEVGDVTWIEFSLQPQFERELHRVAGCQVLMIRSSWAHRMLWRVMYGSRFSWRLHAHYKAYAIFASYLAPLTLRLLATLRRLRPYALFTQDYATGRFDVLLVIARLLGTRFVAYHAGSRHDHYVGRRVRRISLRHADHLIVSSESEREMLISDFKVPRSRVTIVLTPVDLDIFRPLSRTDACRASGLDPDFRYILFVGRFDDRVKRISALVRAFAEVAPAHADARLLIVGDGPDRDYLQTLAADLCPEQAIFLHWVDGAATLANLYNSAEAMILPSRSEGFPTVVGEAIACGTPVVGSDVGGIGEVVVPGKTGWLMESDDDDELVSCLDQVLSDKRALRTMRTQARTMAESRLAPHAVAAQLRDCLGLDWRPITEGSPR